MSYEEYMDENGSLTPAGVDAVILGLEVLGEAARINSAAHGFDLDRPFSEDIALAHSELSEALEEDRDGRGFDEVYFSRKVTHPIYGRIQVPAEKYDKNGNLNKPEGIPAEVADAFIRLAQSASHRRMNVGEVTVMKHEFNVSRPIKHGKGY